MTHTAVMSTADLTDDPIDVVAIGTYHHVGTFELRFADEHWEWSDEVAAMHGYAPGEVTPTTKLVLSHKHPDDRDNVAHAIRDAVTSGAPFSSRHRIIDTSGREHQVVVAGDQLLDADGQVIGTTGFYIDITESLNDDVQTAVDEVVDEFTRARSVVEQAKGMLMLTYGITAERAFEVLRWRSQQTNTKLNRLAAQFVTDMRTMPAGDVLSATVNQLLLTTHRRIDHTIS